MKIGPLCLVAAALAAPPLGAAEPVLVTKLRLASVAQYDAPHGTVSGTVTREQYTPGAWSLAGEPQAGWIRIEAGGNHFWVKNTAIDTNRRVASSADCGAKVGGASGQVAATRALGEECDGKR